MQTASSRPEALAARGQRRLRPLSLDRAGMARHDRRCRARRKDTDGDVFTMCVHPTGGRAGVSAQDEQIPPVSNRLRFLTPPPRSFSLTPSAARMANDSKQDLETRKASASSIRAKHPDRIPVIVDKRSGDSSLPDIDKVRCHPQWRHLYARLVLTRADELRDVIHARRKSSSSPPTSPLASLCMSSGR